MKILKILRGELETDPRLSHIITPQRLIHNSVLASITALQSGTYFSVLLLFLSTSESNNLGHFVISVAITGALGSICGAFVGFSLGLQFTLYSFLISAMGSSDVEKLESQLTSGVLIFSAVGGVLGGLLGFILSAI